MKLIFITIFVYSFCIAIISCNANSKNSETSKSKSDTVIKDIPKSFNSARFRDLKNEILNKVSLPDLENGFDSLQIRIWFGYAFKNHEQLLVLKNQQHNWSGQFYDLLFNYAGKDSLVSIEKQVKEVNPASGWYNLINKMYELDILTLPDRSKIPHYSTDTDGDGVTIEISTRDKYRIYNFQNPGMRQDSIPEAKKIVSIMQLIEDEFGVKRLRKF